MRLDPRTVARALGGDVSGCNILAPGAGHSPADRSLSIFLVRVEPRTVSDINDILVEVP
jgi:hypothetical protein